MRLTLVLAYLISITGLLVPAQACERAAEDRDVFLDVRDEELRILIVNVSDTCTIRFIDTYDVDAANPPRDVPWFLFWKISDGRGQILSRTDYQKSPWYGYASGRFIESDGPPLSRPLTRLAPGEVRLVRVGLHAMMRHVSAVRVLEKKPDLPWGRAVQVEVMFDVYDRAAARGPSSHVAHVTSKPFVHKLPKTRD